VPIFIGRGAPNSAGSPISCDPLRHVAPEEIRLPQKGRCAAAFDVRISALLFGGQCRVGTQADRATNATKVTPRPNAARERTTHINGHVLSHPNIALGPPEDTLECVAEGAFKCVAERRSHPALSPLRP
jgi:hypothetical protein